MWLYMPIIGFLLIKWTVICDNSENNNEYISDTVAVSDTVANMKVNAAEAIINTNDSEAQTYLPYALKANLYDDITTDSSLQDSSAVIATFADTTQQNNIGQFAAVSALNVVH